MRSCGRNLRRLQRADSRRFFRLGGHPRRLQYLDFQPYPVRLRDGERRDEVRVSRRTCFHRPRIPAHQPLRTLLLLYTGPAERVRRSRFHAHPLWYRGSLRRMHAPLSGASSSAASDSTFRKSSASATTPSPTSCSTSSTCQSCLCFLL